MTIFPGRNNDAVHLYARLSKLKPSVILDHEHLESRDVANSSSEGKKRQVLEQARTEVLDQIRNTR